ncbi:MAG: DUF2279 domain-containing protein [Ignavibacteriaceae bacterium]
MLNSVRMFCLMVLLPLSVNIAQVYDSIPNAFQLETRSFQLEKRNIALSPLTEIPPMVDPLATEINYTLLGGIGVGVFGSAYGIMVYQQNAWWKDQRVKFRILNDWEYALWIDKIGHFYGTAIIAHGFSAALEGANVQAEANTWYSSALALSFQLFVEVQDGFGPQWGFSPGDATCDLLGASFPIFQYYYPYLNNFKFKFSYYPADLNKVNEVSGQTHIIIDDYAGQKFWLSMQLKNMLPKKVAEYWPEFLCVAVGMGVNNLDGSGGGQRDFYLALDYDAETIPLYGKYWQFVKNTLNYFHFPMPGIRLTHNVVFFGLTY